QYICRFFKAPTVEEWVILVGIEVTQKSATFESFWSPMLGVSAFPLPGKNLALGYLIM
ncbi:hypothetical protein NL676_038959, partial [Syzygium grande]